MKVWEAEAKTKPKDQPDPLFLFKKKIFLKEDDKEIADTVARNLVYIQVSVLIAFHFFRDLIFMWHVGVT
jgi:hypothetical protein